MGFASISIEVNGLEIDIRRSNRGGGGGRAGQRSRSVSQRSNDHEKQFKSSQTHWDYSDLYGRTISAP